MKVAANSCWVVCFLFLLILLSKSTPAQSQLQDLRGVLPASDKDHSPYIAEIRRALKSGDISSTNAALYLLLEREPGNFEGPFWQGVLHFQQRDYADAVRSLRRAEVLQPNAEVLKLLGLSYYFLGQFRLFSVTMESVIDKDPEDFAPYYWLGRFYVSRDAADFPRATAYFQKALQRNPDHYLSHYYLGYCHESENHPEEAEREYRRSIELAEHANDKFALPDEGLARLQLLATHPEEALSLARKAVEMDPDDAAGHTLLARVYSALNQLDQAATEWKRATELDPNDPVPFYHLYRIYYQQKNAPKAAQARAKYDELVRLYGTN